jgi:hypothetical protein
MPTSLSEPLRVPTYVPLSTRQHQHFAPCPWPRRNTQVLAGAFTPSRSVRWLRTKQVMPSEWKVLTHPIALHNLPSSAIILLIGPCNLAVPYLVTAIK